MGRRRHQSDVISVYLLSVATYASYLWRNQGGSLKTCWCVEAFFKACPCLALAVGAGAGAGAGTSKAKASALAFALSAAGDASCATMTTRTRTSARPWPGESSR